MALRNSTPPKNGTKSTSSNSRIENTGICQTCNHLEICRLRTRHEFPIIFCEEFDNFTTPVNRPHSSVLADSESQNQKERSKTPPAASEGGFKGLCVNCSHRKSCTFRRSDEGVWHCEEYE